MYCLHLMAGHVYTHSFFPPPQRLASKRRTTCVNCTDEESEEKQESRRMSVRRADSTDWIASSLTRRFGLGAGLAWVGVLAFGVISEQIKTRTETAIEQQNIREVKQEKEVILPNNIRYVDITIGGGASPKIGDLVVIDLQAKEVSSNENLIDTVRNKRPIAFVYGTRKQLTGLEYGIQTMRAGGKRKIIIPPDIGVGEKGEVFGSLNFPPNSKIEYIVQLDRVSIAP